jgi:hypothetical protein
MMRAKLLAILMALVMTSATMADLADEATAHVYVEVVATVAVGVQTAVVDLGSVQTGVFGGEVIFRVDANMERLDLQAAVTNLYKGDSLTAESIIPVYEPAGAAVVCDNGNEIQAGDGVLAYNGVTSINGFPALLTEIGTFESGQNGHFSQNVYVTFAWDQTDPELPMGEYSGYCLLRGMILPTGVTAN